MNASKTMVAALIVALSGCYHGLGPYDGEDDNPSRAPGGDGAEDGDDDDDGEPAGRDRDDDPPELVERVGESGLRRLTAAEYDATLRDLLGDTTGSAALLLPEDFRTPYDNDYTLQHPSQALVEGAELLARDAAARLREDPERLAGVIGCEPTGPDDAVCFESFVERFGRRALRRPLDADDVTDMMDLLSAVEDGTFDDAVEAAVRAFLQHPRFLYRVELGTPVQGARGVFELDDFEVATRLSYMLWGSTPDDWLLDVAEDGGLGDGPSISAIAEMMLEDERAHERIGRFHSLWIGYEQMPVGGELGQAMKDETQALVSRVLLDEQRPWQDLLRAEGTYATPELAEHYGLPMPGPDGWVDYGDSGRQGLLSHGSFLAMGAGFDDTSPTQRGILVRTRLLCQDVPEPPPDVDADEPPGGAEDAACKIDRYAVHSQGACAACHDSIDPIGFGLENYDAEGRFRSIEPDNPECEISGDGEVIGVGKFNGPAELSDLVLDTGNIGACVATQLYRFSMGRYELEAHDRAFILRLVDQVASDEFSFAELVGGVVEDPAFRHRREAPSPPSETLVW